MHHKGVGLSQKTAGHAKIQMFAAYRKVAGDVRNAFAGQEVAFGIKFSLI